MAYKVRRFLAKGERCEDAGCIVEFPNYSSVTSIERLAKISDTPPWLGGVGKTYIWNRAFHSWIKGLRGVIEENKRGVVMQIDDPDVLKLFPQFFYRYVPGEVSIVSNNQGVYPLVRPTR